MDLANLEVKINSAPARQATEQFKKLTDEGKKLEIQTQKVTRAWERNVIAFEKNSTSARKLISEQIKAENAIKRQELAAKRLEDQLRRLNDAQNKTHSGLKSLNSSVASISAGISALVATIVTLVTTLGLLKILTLADQFNQLQAKVKNVLPNIDQFDATMARLVGISDKTGISIQSVAQSFTRLAPAAQSIGASTDQLLRFEETFLKVGIVSGATAEEIKNAMIQMSQGLASGTLRGDELRSVMEGMPKVARMLSDQIRKTGETSEQAFRRFKKAAEEGKITSDVVLNGILKNEKLTEEQFKNLPASVERSFGRVQNSSLLLINTFNKMFHVTALVSSGLDGISNALNELNKALQIIEKPFGEIFQDAIDSVIRLDKAIGDLVGTPLSQLIITFAKLDALGLGYWIEQISNLFDRLSTSISISGIAMKRFMFTLDSIKNGTYGSDAFNLGNSVFDSAEQSVLDQWKGRQVGRQVSLLKLKVAVDGPGSKPGKADLGGDNKIKSFPGASKESSAAKKIREFKADLAARESEAQKVLQAQIQGGDLASEKMKDRIEAEDKVRQAHLKIGKDETEMLVQQIVRTKELTRAIEQVSAVQAAQNAATDASVRLDAFNNGGTSGLRKAINAQAIKAALKSSKLDPSSARGQEMAAAISSTQESDLTLSVRQYVEAQKQAIDSEQALYEARLKGNHALRDAEALNEANNQINQMGIQGNEEMEKSIRDITKALSDQKFAREDLNRQMENQVTIENNLALISARQRGLSRNPFTGEMGFFDFEETQREQNRRKSLADAGYDLSSTSGLTALANARKTENSQLSLDGVIQKQEKMLQLANQLGDAFVSAFDQIATGSARVSDVLRNLSKQILKMIMQALIQKAIYASLNGLFGGVTGASTGPGGLLGAGGSALSLPSIVAPSGFARGAAFGGGNVIPFARGGITSGASLFPMSNGRTGMMGEAGEEAIMPLRRMSDGSLGIRAAGGGNVFAPQINVTVQGGSSGNQAQDKALGDAVAKQVHETMKGIINEQIQENLRQGGQLNQGIAS